MHFNLHCVRLTNSWQMAQDEGRKGREGGGGRAAEQGGTFILYLISPDREELDRAAL